MNLVSPSSRLGLIISDPVLEERFAAFLAKTFALENYKFLKAVESFKRTGDEEQGNRIIEKFLVSGAPEELHIDFGVRRPLIEKLDNMEPLGRDDFDNSLRAVIRYIEDDSARKFFALPEMSEAISRAEARRKQNMSANVPPPRPISSPSQSGNSSSQPRRSNPKRRADEAPSIQSHAPPPTHPLPPPPLVTIAPPSSHAPPLSQPPPRPRPLPPPASAKPHSQQVDVMGSLSAPTGNARRVSHTAPTKVLPSIPHQRSTVDSYGNPNLPNLPSLPPPPAPQLSQSSQPYFPASALLGLITDVDSNSLDNIRTPPMSPITSPIMSPLSSPRDRERPDFKRDRTSAWTRVELNSDKKPDPIPVKSAVPTPFLGATRPGGPPQKSQVRQLGTQRTYTNAPGHTSSHPPLPPPPVVPEGYRSSSSSSRGQATPPLSNAPSVNSDHVTVGSDRGLVTSQNAPISQRRTPSLTRSRSSPHLSANMTDIQNAAQASAGGPSPRQSTSPPDRSPPIPSSSASSPTTTPSIDRNLPVNAQGKRHTNVD